MVFAECNQGYMYYKLFYEAATYVGTLGRLSQSRLSWG